MLLKYHQHHLRNSPANAVLFRLVVKAFFKGLLEGFLFSFKGFLMGVPILFVTVRLFKGVPILLFKAFLLNSCFFKCFF